MQIKFVACKIIKNAIEYSNNKERKNERGRVGRRRINHNFAKT